MANRFQTWTQRLATQLKERVGRIDLSALRRIKFNAEQLKKITQWAQASEATRIPAAFTALGVVLSTYFLADLTALLGESFLPEAPIAPVASFSGSALRGNQTRVRRPEDFAEIAERNLFSSKGLIPGEEAIEQPGDPNAAPVRTTLPLALIGTMILRDELKSIATIEDRTAQLVLPLRVQDEIPGKIRITRIEPRRVVFINLSSQRPEFADLPEETGASPRITLGAPKFSAPSANSGIEQVSNNSFNIDRNEIDKALSDLNNILTQARAVPNFENGMPAGYKLFQIVPGSIYEKLGLRNGDTITGLNGDPINDPGKAFELLSGLKTMKHLEMQVKRDGKASTFSYDIRN